MKFLEALVHGVSGDKETILAVARRVAAWPTPLQARFLKKVKTFARDGDEADSMIALFALYGLAKLFEEISVQQNTDTSKNESGHA